MPRFVGIDLGTTYSCVATIEGNTPTVIPGRDGQRTIPSVVSKSTTGEWIVGHLAKRQAVVNPQRTIYGVKRMIGRKWRSEEIRELQKTVPYEIVPAANGDAWVRIDKDDYSPQEISAVILGEIKLIAEEYLGETVTDAIITVPAYFNDSQRQATKDAGAIAGLNVRRIVNEPTAAALGYGLGRDKDQRLAVFDLGGGTFDISILQTVAGVFEVLATSGDTFLGGEDFDQHLMKFLMGEFAAATGVDLKQDACALQRLKEAAENAKRELTGLPKTTINLPFICVGPSGPLHVQHENLTRELFESLTADLIARLEVPCISAMDDAKITRADVDQVLLVGGMSRVPAVQRKVVELFGRQPSKGVNPDEIVALGAAALSAILSGELREVILLDVTPHSLGIRSLEDNMSIIIAKNTSVPACEKKVFATTTDNQEHVNVEIYQGESNRVSQNQYLGQVTLTDLPRLPAGQVVVEVSFMIDADGIVSVTARERTTGKEASALMSPSGGLTPAQMNHAKERYALRLAG